jgi:glycosyltransferase involved in cell wall biosynthesis
MSYRREKIIHCNDLNGLFVGVLSKALNWKQKLIYDSHEFAINDIPNQSYYSIKAKYFLEKILIRFADQVIVVSDSIANEYSRLYNIKKPNLILNCPAYIEQNKNDIFRQNLGIKHDQLIFLYQGGLSGGRGIEILLKAFELRAELDCVLVCMGYGPLEEMVKGYSSRNQNIFYHPAVAQNILLDYTSSADFGILFYEDSCLNHRFCSPNKIFEY